jgi:polyphosphate kinase 2 (PPK2 family)
MNFCTEEEYREFMTVAPDVEHRIVDNGIILLKYFLDVSQAEQRKRFQARISDPLKHWKLSPMDTESVRRWWDYTKAYQDMIRGTDTPHAPWFIVPADDKRRARLNLIHHMLEQVPYRKIAPDLPKLPRAKPRPKGLKAGLGARHVVENRY